jgi:hypothetical protein
MLMYVTMVYGPIAAFVVEFFPTQIRYTSVSLPNHIGTAGSTACFRCWPLPWSPPRVISITACGIRLFVAIMTLVIGALFLRETKDRDIRSNVDYKLPTADINH